MALIGGKPQPQKKLSPWPIILVLIVLVVAFGLKIVDALRKDPVVPTSEVPAVSFDDIRGNTATPPTTPPPTTPPGTPTPPPAPEPTPTPVPTPAPSASGELNLAVPFTSQAPTGNWDVVHEDTCEEASFLMVVEYYNGRAAGKMDPAYVDPILYDMVDQETTAGMGYSITAAEAESFIESYYNLSATVVNNPSADQIKQLVAEGKPVIVPAAGRELGNPFFTGEGPLYHMLVIRGYTADTFITNDPGTRNGENYVYGINTIMEAMGDWNNGDPGTGAKRIIYIDP